jgi:hypothetical protein
MNKIVNQHGDLLFMECSKLPKDVKEISVSPGYVLERGEGVHTHVLDDVEGVSVYEGKDGEIYVNVSKDVTINHEEHGKQTLKPGIYKKSIERVWDYESEEMRRVID